MNARHKINRRDNRLRRIARRVTELNAAKAEEIIAAARYKREPNLSGILAQLERLRVRELNLKG